MSRRARIRERGRKNVVATADKLYVSVASNSNAAENGIEKEDGRAAIGESILRRARIGSLHTDCAIRSGWRGNQKLKRCGSRSTNAMSSAAISSRTT